MKIKLTEIEMREQLDNILDFLQKVHPELIKNKNKMDLPEGVYKDNLAIEIRPLKRDGGNPSWCNHRVYGYSVNQKDALGKFLNKVNNADFNCCMYYSVYAFNYTVLGVSKSGKESKTWNNKVCLNNSIGTHILISDFDHITQEEFLKYKQIYSDLGIETIDVFSGHGYQQIVLLDKLSLDKDLLKKYTNLLISRGFPVDLKIKDSARIMRLPFTFNSKDKDNPVRTGIISNTSLRYSVEDIFNKLESLPVVNNLQTEIRLVNLNSSKTEKIDKLDKSNKKEEVKNKKIDFSKESLDRNILENLYPMINFSTLPSAIRLMLSGFQDGFANSVLMFLVLYLKEQGYSLTLVKDIINILKSLNTYNYAWEDLQVDAEVKRFYYSTSYSSKAIFFGELKVFGAVDYSFKNKDIVTVNNYVFTKLNSISSTSFYIYIKMLEKYNYNGLSVFTLTDLVSITGLSKRSALDNLQFLIITKLVDKKRAYKKNGEEYKYFISKFTPDSSFGFTSFNIATLKLLLKLVNLKELTTTQLCICMYIKKCCYGTKEDCSVSQSTLANIIGVTQQGISKSFKKIEELELIKREKEEIGDFKFKYNYTVHF